MTCTHFRKVCKHGVVTEQCRCIGPKTVTIVPCPPSCDIDTMTDLPEGAATDAHLDHWESGEMGVNPHGLGTDPMGEDMSAGLWANMLAARIRHDAERIAELERANRAFRDYAELGGKTAVAQAIEEDRLRQNEGEHRRAAKRIAELEALIKPRAKAHVAYVERLQRERDEARAALALPETDLSKLSFREALRSEMLVIAMGENAELREALEKADEVAKHADHYDECSGPDGCVCGLEGYREAREATR